MASTSHDLNKQPIKQTPQLDEADIKINEECQQNYQIFLQQLGDQVNEVIEVKDTETFQYRAKIDKINLETMNSFFNKVLQKNLQAKAPRRNWADEELHVLIWLTLQLSNKYKIYHEELLDEHWEQIASIIPNKDREICVFKWMSMKKCSLSQAPWTRDEDELLLKIMQESGTEKNKWNETAKELHKQSGKKFFRKGKQCRERWNNYLDPNMRRGAWTDQEDLELLQYTQDKGCKWSQVAKKLKGRTENAVKNRFKSLIKKEKKTRLKQGMSFHNNDKKYLQNANSLCKQESSELDNQKLKKQTKKQKLEEENVSQDLDNNNGKGDELNNDQDKEITLMLIQNLESKLRNSTPNANTNFQVQTQQPSIQIHNQKPASISIPSNPINNQPNKIDSAKQQQQNSSNYFPIPSSMYTSATGNTKAAEIATTYTSQQLLNQNTPTLLSKTENREGTPVSAKNAFIQNGTSQTLNSQKEQQINELSPNNYNQQQQQIQSQYFQPSQQQQLENSLNINSQITNHLNQNNFSQQQFQQPYSTPSYASFQMPITNMYDPGMPEITSPTKFGLKREVKEEPGRQKDIIGGTPNPTMPMMPPNSQSMISPSMVPMTPYTSYYPYGQNLQNQQQSPAFNPTLNNIALQTPTQQPQYPITNLVLQDQTPPMNPQRLPPNTASTPNTNPQNLNNNNQQQTQYPFQEMNFSLDNQGAINLAGANNNISTMNQLLQYSQPQKNQSFTCLPQQKQSVAVAASPAGQPGVKNIQSSNSMQQQYSFHESDKQDISQNQEETTNNVNQSLNQTKLNPNNSENNIEQIHKIQVIQSQNNTTTNNNNNGGSQQEIINIPQHSYPQQQFSYQQKFLNNSSQNQQQQLEDSFTFQQQQKSQNFSSQYQQSPFNPMSHMPQQTQNIYTTPNSMALGAGDNAFYINQNSLKMYPMDNRNISPNMQPQKQENFEGLEGQNKDYENNTMGYQYQNYYQGSQLNNGVYQQSFALNGSATQPPIPLNKNQQQQQQDSQQQHILGNQFQQINQPQQPQQQQRYFQQEYQLQQTNAEIAYEQTKGGGNEETANTSSIFGTIAKKSKQLIENQADMNGENNNNNNQENLNNNSIFNMASKKGFKKLQKKTEDPSQLQQQQIDGFQGYKQYMNENSNNNINIPLQQQQQQPTE